MCQWGHTYHEFWFKDINSVRCEFAFLQRGAVQGTNTSKEWKTHANPSMVVRSTQKQSAKSTMTCYTLGHLVVRTWVTKDVSSTRSVPWALMSQWPHIDCLLYCGGVHYSEHTLQLTPARRHKLGVPNGLSPTLGVQYTLSHTHPY